MCLSTIISRAKLLEIALTNATIGTPECKAWVSACKCAIAAFDANDMRTCQHFIDRANSLAV